ncbi:MAG: WG repeat-containing protein [Bacteroidia bacterium]|jgi:hypothetical protein
MKTIKLLSLLIVTILIQEVSTAQTIFLKQDEANGLYGFANEEGEYVVQPLYKEVDYNFGGGPGLFYVVNKNGKNGFIDETGKEVVPCKYDEVTSFNKGYAFVKINAGESAQKHGMVDTKGREAIPCIYDEAIFFEQGYSIVKIKTGEFEYKHGLVDSTGKLIIPAKYGRLEYYPNDKVLVFGDEKTSNVGLMDVTGKIIIPAQYQFWSKKISKGLWPVGTWPEGTQGVCGVVNLKNQTVIPFEYEMIESYSDELGLAPAKKDGKYGFIDRTGKVVIPFIYKSVWASNKYLAVKKDDKWGIITTDNKTILPFEYSDISSIMEKTAWVTKNESEGEYEIDLTSKQKVK